MTPRPDREGPPAGTSRRRTDAYDRYIPLLVEYHGLDRDDPRAEGLRERLVVAFRPVAHNVAARFAGRREPVEDLEQVALMGLLHALDRYDPGRGDFLSYAIPTMMGEVRRHFRDASWSVRTPRSVKDRYLQVGTATATLSQRLGRAPTVAELAEHLQIGVDDVAEGIAAGSSYRPVSLDRPPDASDDAGAVVDLLGETDARLDQAETRTLLRHLTADLPERERRLLVLRFVHEQTQREIAAELCISQMHVSRLLVKTLGLLRERAAPRAVDDLVPEQRRSGTRPPVAS